MPALAHQFARLVGSFHGTFSAARKTRVFCSLPVRHNFNAGARLARLIRDPSRLVNATLSVSFCRIGRGLPACPKARFGIVCHVVLTTKPGGPDYEICVTGPKPRWKLDGRLFDGCSAGILPVSADRLAVSPPN